jgi:predicted nucleic acid-binding protein
MTVRAFVDTNVLVYAFDEGEPEKQQVARRVLAQDDGSTLVISAQVLAEFFVVVTRTRGRKLSPTDAAQVVEGLSRLPVIAVDAPLVRAAMATSQRHQLSYWDAQIVEAAATAGCEVLYSEELADGSTVRGVTIQNPFA